MEKLQLLKIIEELDRKEEKNYKESYVKIKSDTEKIAFISKSAGYTKALKDILKELLLNK